MLQDNSSIEYAKNGTATEFQGMDFQVAKRLELKFENAYLSGQWVGLFYNQEGHTTLDFTENIRCKKWWLIPFAGRQLRNMQRQYMKDLMRVFGTTLGAK